MENSELITRALSYIRDDMSNSGMTIENVAKQAGFSTDYFNRIFLAHTGFNVMEYVRISRLKKAAILLRSTERNILDIALDCGYESPESLCRAFHKQYDMSPVEYRERFSKSEALYGEYFNDTVGARLTHEFSKYRVVDPNEAIETMLEKNALKYGMAAIDCKNNGGAALCDGDLRGGLVWFTEWDGRFNGDIIADDYDKIAEYLKTFNDARFDLRFYTLDDEQTIKNELAARGLKYSEIKRSEIRACTAEFTVSPPPAEISIRECTYEDYPLIERHYAENKDWKYRLGHLKQELYQRYVLGNEENSVFFFGLFEGEEMIGCAEGRLQRANGFVVNNEIAMMPDPDYRREEVYRYMFSYITNEALKRGALPIDTVHIPGSPQGSRRGEFDSAEFGYRTVSYCSSIGV